MFVINILININNYLSIYLYLFYVKCKGNKANHNVELRVDKTYLNKRLLVHETTSRFKRKSIISR